MRPLRPSEASCVVGGEGGSASRRGVGLGGRSTAFTPPSRRRGRNPQSGSARHETPCGRHDVASMRRARRGTKRRCLDASTRAAARWRRASCATGGGESGTHLGTSGASHQSLADLLHGEHGGRLDVIPLLLEEDVLLLLLSSLLALGHALVLADRHLARMGGSRSSKRARRPSRCTGNTIRVFANAEQRGASKNESISCGKQSENNFSRLSRLSFRANKAKFARTRTKCLKATAVRRALFSTTGVAARATSTVARSLARFALHDEQTRQAGFRHHHGRRRRLQRRGALRPGCVVEPESAAPADRSARV